MKTKKNKKKKIEKTSYEELIEDPKQKKLLDEEYQELLISELILAAMKGDNTSVRRLAKDAGVSPTTIQELRSGKKTNISIAKFNRILNTIGYQISVEPIRR